MKSYCLQVPDDGEHPYREVVDGLKASGLVPDEDHGELLVTWSPWRDSLRGVIANKHLGRIVVLENGWLQPIAGVPYYSVCLWGWNGVGVWRAMDDGERFLSQVKPLMGTMPGAYSATGPVVVVEQRGCARDPRTMPPGWHNKARKRLEKLDLPCITRLREDKIPILEYFQKFIPRGIVTWSSAVASWAILAGIPVAYCGPSIWCWELATWWNWESDEKPYFGINGRLTTPVMARLAWSQWTSEELKSGEPFRKLLG